MSSSSDKNNECAEAVAQAAQQARKAACERIKKHLDRSAQEAKHLTELVAASTSGMYSWMDGRQRETAARLEEKIQGACEAVKNAHQYPNGILEDMLRGPYD